MEPPAATGRTLGAKGRLPRRTAAAAEKKAEAENKAKKDKLKTAMGTCLEAKGYTVK
jgi:hypothetical protein